jgi:hypothetical protein
MTLAGVSKMVCGKQLFLIVADKFNGRRNFEDFLNAKTARDNIFWLKTDKFNV